MRFLTACIALFAIAACATGGGFSSSAREPGPSSGWTEANAVALIDFVRGIDANGLRAEDYPAAELSNSLARRDWIAVDIAARETFRRVAHDLSVGAPLAAAPVGWRYDGPVIDPEEIDAAVDTALATGAIAETLESFEPKHGGYRALKEALKQATGAQRETIRVNMDRWRRMPREFGADYVLVNIPAFEAAVIRDSEEIARHHVIVGARRTPTPQFSARVEGVIFNPTWFVPPSIVAESIGAQLKNNPAKARAEGYYLAPDGGVRQKPGPQNALGRMKLVMANPYSVYIHDTPQKKLFDKDDRALSHGCVRIDGALDFAATLLSGELDRMMIDELIATNASITIALAEPIPVYIGYFTADATTDGISFYKDVYGLDEAYPAPAENDATQTECASSAD